MFYLWGQVMRHQTQEVPVQHANPLANWKGLSPKFRNLVPLFGWEGAEGDEGSGAQTSTGGEGSGTQAPNASAEGDGQESKDKTQDTFDRSYVEKLRAEAADWRTKHQALQKEKEEREKAEMSEVERLKVEKEEAEARIKATEESLITERKRNAIIAIAATLKFRDPEDAIAHIDLSEIVVNDDGSPHKGSVESAVKKVAESKTYLISGTGSADGGTTGSPPPPDDEKLKQYESEIREAGGVSVPSW